MRRSGRRTTPTASMARTRPTELSSITRKHTPTASSIPTTPTCGPGLEDPRFSPPADGGQPQNQLTGSLFMVNRGPNDTGTPINVPYSDSQLRFWRNTSVAGLQPGQTATLGDYELGYEWDENVDNGFQPAGLINMSSTTEAVTQLMEDYGNTFGPGTATNSMTLYRASVGPGLRRRYGPVRLGAEWEPRWPWRHTGLEFNTCPRT